MHKNNKRAVVWFIYRWAVPLLLVGIALRQIILARTVGLAPWKGGGFGMFSSVDKLNNRLLYVEGTTVEGEVVKVDSDSLENSFLSRKIELLLAIPQQELLEEVAEKLLDFDFYPNEKKGVYRLATTEESDLSPTRLVRLKQVKVQVCRLHFDSKIKRIRYEPLSETVKARGL